MIPRPVRGLLFVSLGTRLGDSACPRPAWRAWGGGGGGGGGGAAAVGDASRRRWRRYPVAAVEVGCFSRSPAVSSPRPAQRPSLAGGGGGRPATLPSRPAGGVGRPGAGPAPAVLRHFPPVLVWVIAPAIGGQPGIGNRPGIGGQPGIGNRPGGVGRHRQPPGHRQPPRRDRPASATARASTTARAGSAASATAGHRQPPRRDRRHRQPSGHRQPAGHRQSARHRQPGHRQCRSGGGRQPRNRPVDPGFGVRPPAYNGWRVHVLGLPPGMGQRLLARLPQQQQLGMGFLCLGSRDRGDGLGPRFVVLQLGLCQLCEPLLRRRGCGSADRDRANRRWR